MSKGQSFSWPSYCFWCCSRVCYQQSRSSFFIHATGGCRKTFLCNTIAAKVKRRGQVALCVALSGIAALLLDRGKISHSCFKIPLFIHKDSVAGLKCNSYMFLVLQQTKIIIWDEVHIQHKYDIDAVDQCLRDLLEVSNHLHLIALELTHYIEWPSIWWNYSGIWRRFSSDFACSAQRNTLTSSNSISLQKKLMETYQVLASQTEYVLGSLWS